jgi:hypothetical protein
MGGPGSTRWFWHRKKMRVEDCYRLSVFYLHEHNLIIPDANVEGAFNWGKDRAEVSFQINTEERHRFYLRLSYAVKVNGEIKEKVNTKVYLTETYPNWGGVRYWFVCPYCGRRIAKLYLPYNGYYFKCRTCYDLTYVSCRESHIHDRMFDVFYPGIPYRWAKRIWERDIGRA